MSSIKEHFEIPGRYKQWSFGLMGVGILALIIGFIMYGNVEHGKRFWSTLLQNSVYFLLIVNAAMFFMCATTLAWGGFQMSFRRVTEAISAAVPVLGIICAVILFAIVFGGNHEIYHWTDTEHVNHDEILLGKSGFLNKNFFVFYGLTCGFHSSC